jgi:hypothetical protein
VMLKAIRTVRVTGFIVSSAGTRGLLPTQYFRENRLKCEQWRFPRLEENIRMTAEGMTRFL